MATPPLTATIVTTDPPSLSTLPLEILYQIFKLLDRPSKLSYTLTGPVQMHLIGQCFNIEEHREDLKVPSHISFQEPVGQAAIIRYVHDNGCNDGGLASTLRQYRCTPPLVPFPSYAAYIRMSDEKNEEDKELAQMKEILIGWLGNVGDKSFQCKLCERDIKVWGLPDRWDTYSYIPSADEYPWCGLCFPSNENPVVECQSSYNPDNPKEMPKPVVAIRAFSFSVGWSFTPDRIMKEKRYHWMKRRFPA